MRIAASPEERSKLADKIAWFEKYKNLEVADQRAQARCMPQYPFSTLILADGTVKAVSFSTCRLAAPRWRRT